MESQPDYPKNLANGEIHNQRVADLLTQPLYAGYVMAPNWDIALHKGQHQGLITLETYEKIQTRLREGAKAPVHKNISQDFPLRGFVLCGDCEKPLTACWSTSKTGRSILTICATTGAVRVIVNPFREIASKVNLKPSCKLCSLRRACSLSPGPCSRMPGISA